MRPLFQAGIPRFHVGLLSEFTGTTETHAQYQTYGGALEKANKEFDAGIPAMRIWDSFKQRDIYTISSDKQKKEAIDADYVKCQMCGDYPAYWRPIVGKNICFSCWTDLTMEYEQAEEAEYITEEDEDE